MSIDRRLLEILCCPVSKTPVRRIDKETLEIINAAARQGEALQVDGTPLEAPLDDAIITDDGKVVYPIVDDIPVMLAERGIGTLQFNL